jgi:hypothetical protein
MVSANDHSRWEDAMKGLGWLVRDLFVVGLVTAPFVVLLGGCASISFDFGTPPKIEHLRQLRRGASSISEVRSLLGSPRGKGAVRIPVGYRTLWLYDSGRFDPNRSRIRYLLVFIDGETYDGYLWFDVDTKYEERYGTEPNT